MLIIWKWLNSYGDLPIANYIRELVRVVQGVNNRIHELFEYSQVVKETQV